VPRRRNPWFDLRDHERWAADLTHPADRDQQPLVAPRPPAASLPADRDSLPDALDELEAARGRVERDADRGPDDDRRRLVSELLPVVDNLDRSITAARAHGNDDLVAGLDLVKAQFLGVLTGFGVARIDSVGRRFDPQEHDAVAVVDVNEPERDGIVLEEWQPGYRLGDRVLRAARVRVGKLRARPSRSGR
jgi:molecular chaperone GrpE